MDCQATKTRMLPGGAMCAATLAMFVLAGCVFEGGPLSQRACSIDADCPEDGRACIDGYCQQHVPECESAADCVDRLGALSSCQAAVCSDDGKCTVGLLDEGTQCRPLEGCITAACDALGACVTQANDAACQDGVTCNGAERCAPDNPDADEEGCVPGPDIVDDGIDCTIDTCDEENGVMHDDANCTCTGDAQCTGMCRTGMCVQGQCTFDPLPEGTACDDGLACTSGDQCNADQVCIGAPDASFCDDGLFCNGEEACDPLSARRDMEGCIQTPRELPDDGIECTRARCDEDNDEIVIDASNCECQRDNDCTAECMQGACNAQYVCNFRPAPPETRCDDGIQCTINDVCGEDQACAGTPSDVECADESFCNGDEVCNPRRADPEAGGCVPGTPLVDVAEPPGPCLVPVCTEEPAQVTFVEAECCVEGPFGDATCYDDIDNDCNDDIDLEDEACAFQPSRYGDLRLWLDPSDDDNLELMGQNVERWIDRSGRQNDGTGMRMDKPSVSEGAQNGLNALDFDGDNEYIAIANEGEFDAVEGLTVFIVFQSDGLEDTFEALLTKGEGTWRIHRQRDQPRIAYHVNSGDTEVNVTSQTNVDNTGFHLVTAHTEGRVHSLYVNGVREAQGTLPGAMNQNNSPVHIADNDDARDREWDGKVGEVLIYLSALTDEDRAAIEAYLMYKWGLTAP